MMRRAFVTFGSTAAMMLMATSASAACAWVLWTQHTFVNVPDKALPIDRGEWQLQSAMPTQTDCNEAARLRAQRHGETFRELTNVASLKMVDLIGGGFLIRTNLKQPEHASISVEFMCFPDTVDPRGPKGNR